MIDIGYKRLESVRVIVDEMILKIADAGERRCANLHLYSVSQFAAMLAKLRGLDPEISAVAGMLHDFYVYKTGIQEFHDQNGAEAVRPILRELGIFTKGEQKLILCAVFHHSDKSTINAKYDEVLKDADVFQHYFYNVGMKVRISEVERLTKVLNELSLPCDFKVADAEIFDVKSTLKGKSTLNEKCKAGRASIKKRILLADVAESLASKGIVGIPADDDYRDICNYWPDDNIYKVLKDQWCGAFVYYCCKKSGFSLPIRYPSGSCRFAGVYAWLEWARLEELNFFHSIDENSFIPERGDIVIYEKLITESSHDHIGIILSCDNNSLFVAEGNIDNKNQSGIIQRDRYEKILGYVRIDNNYLYKFDGEYNPKLD